MATYQIFLWAGDEPANVSIEAVCDSDREAREVAQRMLIDGDNRGGRAEVWVDSRFVAAVVAARVLQWKAAELPVVA